MNHYTFTGEDICSTLEQFIECFSKVFNKISDSDKLIINDYCKRISLFNPAFILRPDFIKKVNDDIFYENVITTFIFDLSFKFFTTCSTDDFFVEKLANHLANGITVDGFNNKNLCFMPDMIAESCALNNIKSYMNLSLLEKVIYKIKQLFNYPDDKVALYLANNKHLMLVLLIILTI